MRLFINELHMIVDRNRTAQQLMKFCLVGVINTSVDFAIYVGLTRIFVYWNERLVWAAIISCGCGLLSSFVLNNFWTFQRNHHEISRCLPKFLLVALLGIVWNAGLVYLLVSLGVYDLIAKAFATIFVLVWNFVLQKKWTFRN
jgi:putative flippase GtrA